MSSVQMVYLRFVRIVAIVWPQRGLLFIYALCCGSYFIEQHFEINWKLQWSELNWMHTHTHTHTRTHIASICFWHLFVVFGVAVGVVAGACARGQQCSHRGEYSIGGGFFEF